MTTTPDAANVVSLRKVHDHVALEIAEVLRRTNLCRIRVQDERHIAIMADFPYLTTRIAGIELVVPDHVAHVTATYIPFALEVLAAGFRNVEQLDLMVQDPGGCDYGDIRRGIKNSGDVIDRMGHLEVMQIRDTKLESTKIADEASERERHDRRSRGAVLFELAEPGFVDRRVWRKRLRSENGCLEWWLKGRDKESRPNRGWWARRGRQPG